MSNREFAKSLIDQIPENKLFFAIAYLQGISAPDEIPNAETLDAMAEVEEMIRNGIGQHFQGSAEEFTNMLLSED